MLIISVSPIAHGSEKAHLVLVLGQQRPDLVIGAVLSGAMAEVVLDQRVRSAVEHQADELAVVRQHGVVQRREALEGRATIQSV